MSQGTPTTGRQTAAALEEAAGAAGYAPSILNTQPWRWRVGWDRLELFAERSRQLTASDPQGRLLTLSCGAALHHARVALAADGWATQVTRLPKRDAPDLLATLVVNGRIPVTVEAMRLRHAIQTRHTDRRPVSEKPLPEAGLEAIAAAARVEADLEVLTRHQLTELASAVALAEELEADDPYIMQELKYWTSHAEPEGTGIPAGALLDRPPQTTVPARDYGRPGTLPTGRGHDRAAVYALLFGHEDLPRAWLDAGEALSAAWLTATDLGVSLVPFSGVIEIPGTRQALRLLLAGMGQPYLVLRLGIAETAPARPVHTPRLPTAQVVDSSAVQANTP